MGMIWQDVRYSLRRLIKSPGFTVAVVLTLALGIGFNSALFSMIHMVLIKPLPYPDGHRLVQLQTVVTAPGKPTEILKVWSYPYFERLREHGRVFSQIAACADDTLTLTQGDTPERVEAELVSASYFSLLGLKPQLGRVFEEQEDRTPGAHPVAVISDGLRRRCFGSQADVIGKTICLNKTYLTVVGVLPAWFKGQLGSADVWAPITMAPILQGSPERLTRPFTMWHQVLACLDRADQSGGGARGDGLSGKADRDRLSLAGSDERLGHPFGFPAEGEYGPGHSPLPAGVAGGCGVRPADHLRQYRRPAAGTGRLPPRGDRDSHGLGCNARTNRPPVAGRERGFVRRSRGAGAVVCPRRSRPAGGLPTGRGPGIPCPICPAAGLRRNWAQHARAALQFRPRRWLAESSSASFRLCRPRADRWRRRREERRTSAPTGARPGLCQAHSVLVVGQTALAIVLLVGAGLTLRSFVRLMTTRVGFEPADLLTFQVTAPQGLSQEAWSSAVEQVEQRIASISGVQSVCVADATPLSGTYDHSLLPLRQAGSENGGTTVSIGVHRASPGYIRALRVPLVAGRWFTEQDTDGARRVVVINETMARRYWPATDPVGQSLDLEMAMGPGYTPVEIVGVVADVKYDDMAAQFDNDIYVPYLQSGYPCYYVAVRTAGDPLSMVGAVRQAVTSVSRELPVSDVMTMSQRIANSTSRTRFIAVLLVLFAVLALVLAVTGLYGLIAYSIAQRTREIGIRMALGARSSQVLRLTLCQGMGLVIVGTILGVAAALALTRLLQSLLYEVSAADPLAFVAATSLLILAALVACCVPAWRAARIDPMAALRCE